MKYYIRNFSTKICFYNEDLIVTGGRYNKKIKANDSIFQILRKTSKAMKEEELLEYLNINFKIEYDIGEILLSKLLKLGFLETNIVYSLQGKDYKSKDFSKIKSFNIPTYLRPKELYKCIESYSNNFEKNSHYIDYYVFDDTPLDKSRENYKALKQLTNNIQINIFYIGLEEKKKFIDIIARECGVERRLIDFAFMPNNLFESHKLFMSGANRNCILAYTIGDCFLMADDDSCCLGFENNINSGVCFSTGRGSISKQYIQKEDLKQITHMDNLDILGEHEKYIGKSLKEILYNKKIKDITFDMITPNNDIFPNNYVFYENSKVHFTFNPTLGWPDQTADDALYDYLYNKNKEYLLGTSNKTIFESVEEDTIYSSPFLLTTTLTGIDNRKSHCPFMPIYRNEDIHYGYLLNYLDPYTLSSCINVGLLHNKKKSTNQLEAFYKNFYGDIVLSYILYKILRRIKIKLPKEYLNTNIRKLIFSSSIKNICGNNQYDFTNNLLGLNIGLKKLWYEKKDLISSVYNDIHEDKNLFQISECFIDFNKFMASQEWELMRITLILYSDLLLEWDNIMDACYRLKLQGRLPQKKI